MILCQIKNKQKTKQKQQQQNLTKPPELYQISQGINETVMLFSRQVMFDPL